MRLRSTKAEKLSEMKERDFVNEKSSWLMTERFLRCEFLKNSVAQLERPYVTLLFVLEGLRVC